MLLKSVNGKRIKRFILFVVFSYTLFTLFSDILKKKEERVDETIIIQPSSIDSIRFEREQSILKFIDQPADHFVLGERLRLFDELHQLRNNRHKDYRKIYRALFPWIKDKTDLDDRFHGDGIVMFLQDRTGKDEIINAYSNIHIIRLLQKSELPIQIFYGSEDELSLKSRDLLGSIDGVTVHSLEGNFDLDSLKIHGYVQRH